MRAYFAACEGLSGRLVRAICSGLGVSDDALDSAFRPGHTSFLRLNYYPTGDPLADEGRQDAGLGVHHHTDAGALTVLLQDGVSGLQVQRASEWHDVAPLPGALVINIGDMVQVWSNDLYRAPVHRVVAMTTQDRFSVPFFHNPSYQAVVAPLASVVERSGRVRFRDISWAEFRRRRAEGDFADYGQEVQISDYRL